jgi:hypothetical protein
MYSLRVDETTRQPLPIYLKQNISKETNIHCRAVDHQYMFRGDTTSKGERTQCLRDTKSIGHNVQRPHCQGTKRPKDTMTQGLNV